MILKHRHTCLVVADAFVQKEFYEGLGLHTVYREAEMWADRVLVVLKLATAAGEIVLELIEGPWKHHICFEVSELPPGPYVHERITDDYHTVFIRDPEGNLIELTKIKEG